MTEASSSRLEASIIWGRAGHLTDAGVVAVADGEIALLPDAALTHCESCPSCSARVGQAALVSLDLAEVLGPGFATVTDAIVEPSGARRGGSPSESAGGSDHRVARRPFPVAVLLGALTLAVVGLLPGASRLVASVERWTLLLGRACPVLARMTVPVFRSLWESPTFAAIGWLSALLLVLAGVVVARLDGRGARSRSERGAV
jgi:hypothetical protein